MCLYSYTYDFTVFDNVYPLLFCLLFITLPSGFHRYTPLTLHSSSRVSGWYRRRRGVLSDTLSIFVCVACTTHFGSWWIDQGT